MNTNTMRCMQVQEKSHIVKQIQLGSTTVKFCDDCIAKTDEERALKIKDFKRCALRLFQNVSENEQC